MDYKADQDKFSYFMDRTEKDLDYIKNKIDELWDFRTRLIGISALVSTIFSVLIALATLYIKARGAI